MKEIVSLYHETLPELRRVKCMTNTREKMLKSRWRENPARQSLDWWRKLFRYIKTCDFLMGRVKPEFQVDLGWIIKPENFAKIIEGKYETK
jgi:hypothetical protein